MGTVAGRRAAGLIAAGLGLPLSGQGLAPAASPGPGFLGSHPLWLAWLAALAGLLGGAAVVSLLGVGRRRRCREELERLVADRPAALKAEQDGLNAIFDASPVGMLVLDETGAIIRANAAAAALPGAQAGCALGAPLGVAFHCVYCQDEPARCGHLPGCQGCALREAVTAVCAGGAAIRGREVAMTVVRDGQPQPAWLQVGIAPLSLAGRRQAVMAVEDVTERRLATETLRQWNARIHHELELAGRLQKTLLAVRPVLTAALQADVAYRSSLQVGGDFVDTVSMADGRVCLYIGDVAGHGVGPAMVSSMLKALIPALVRDLAPQGPAAICNELQQRFAQLLSDPTVYATFLLAVFDPLGGTLRSLNCGHPRPVLLDRRQVDLSDAFGRGGGLPIGMAESSVAAPYSQTDEVLVSLPPGAALLVYTDGLSESRHRETRTMSSAGGVAKAFQSLLREGGWNVGAQGIFQRLEADGYEIGADDCSAVLIHITDPAEVKLQQTVPCELNAVSHLGEAVATALVASGWPEVGAQSGRLLVVEYCTNVIKHGRTPPGAALRIQMAVRGRQCRFLCFDTGIEWDLQRSAVDLDQVGDLDEHGRGLGIVRALASRIEFCRSGSENCAMLVFEHHGE